MGVIDTTKDRLGRWLARRITSEKAGYEPYAASRPELVSKIIRPGDVLLVEGGRTKVSAAIKYLTQSTWSHAALYVGEEAGLRDADGNALTLVEAELGIGIAAVSLSKYASYNTRICRPVAIAPQDRARVIRYVIKHIGGQYDLKNVFDLMRYLLPTPPVPARFRRKMIGFGSGEPTRAICSTLIARAFEKVRYPILPIVEMRDTPDEKGVLRRKEVMHIRHYSLYTPRDFDTSPFFQVIKPTIETGFDYRNFVWSDPETAQFSVQKPRAIPIAPERAPISGEAGQTRA
ncbi:Permuted papain-like amidase enzyme, YaeF/YiiX, C92 family [Rhabdaerophilaceae bacterium]